MHSGHLRKAALKSVSAPAMILVLISSIAIAIAVTPARAQDDSSPSSDSGYQNGQIAPQIIPQAIPNDTSDANPADDGQNVTVPIPGGGDVSVAGPAPDQPDTTQSGQNWSTDTQDPNSAGGSAMGTQ